jgi:uncharacterized repeat protein (TIGR02543 family)
MFQKKNRLRSFSKNFTQTAFFILFLLMSYQANAQDVSINEIMSSNDTTIADEDGEFEDWIEIYNYGTTPVNLNGFGLSDQIDNPFKWTFPNIELAPKEYIIVWASDKNRVADKDKLHTNFKIKSGGEALILTSASGTQLNESPAVTLATDKSYGRIPNGTGNWTFLDTPTPKTNNSGASSANPEKISINELVSSNVNGLQDEDGSNEDWIEIYNYGSVSVNLSGFGLSDDKDLPYKWVFPSVTINPNEFIVVYASSKDRSNSGSQLHTNFKIGAGGENLILTNDNGLLVSGAPSVNLAEDTSYGRQPDGTGSWLFFSTPTPGTTNNGSGDTTSLEAPDFSHTSGLYEASINVTLSTDNQNATIVYTLDGSEPDINNLNGSSFSYKNDYAHEVGESPGAFLNQNYTSFSYTSPISISDRSSVADQLANKNTVSDELYVPPVSVRKSSVLRAKVYLNGIGSRTRTRNYFVWPNGNPYSVPLVALTTFEGNLFEYTDGIYTSGAIFDQWRIDNPNGNQPDRPDFSNFGQSGRDWERNVNVQIFNSNLESILSQDAGLRIHGNTSRSHRIKNLRLYARSEYDEDNEFEFDLFSQQIPNSPKLYNNKFKRFLLRGNGSGGYIANDVVFSRLMQPFFNGIMRIETAVNFINGEYFGITAFRDRFDEHHIANNFGLDSGNVSIVGCVGNCANEEGDPEAYNDLSDLFQYIKDTNLQVSSNYNYVKNRLDIDSYINHVFIEVFPEGDSYETKYWKATNVVDDSFGDGKWRIYTQDFESAMKSTNNWLDNFLEEASIPNRGLLRHLIKNEEFKNKLLNRFSDLMNTGFNQEHFTDIVNNTFDKINPLLDEDNNRAPRNRFYSNSDKNRLLDWILERPIDFREQLKVSFSIDGTLDLVLNVSNLNAGYIILNTIDLIGATPGVKDKPYPWSGIYFENVPITLEAKPRAGYTFSRWTGASSSTNSKITITPTSDTELRAVFTPDEDYDHLLYFWLLDDEIDNDIPLESLNSTYSRNNLTAMMNYNSSLSGYPFNANNSNWRKASLERINEPTAINYQDLANDNIPFAPQIMKGLQIKQPFESGSSQNSLELDFSTIDYEDVKVSIAVSSDGAANTIMAQYWNGSGWVTSNLPNNAQSINSDYERKEFDFSNVTMADENESFKVRFSFSGTNMTEEDGKKVIINNIAVSAIDKNVLSAEDFILEDTSLSIYPNPAKDRIYISSNTAIDKILVYNIFGQMMYKSSKKDNSTIVDISNFAKGIYLVKVFSKNAITTKKIIKK